jgi:hypothetical protein
MPTIHTSALTVLLYGLFTAPSWAMPLYADGTAAPETGTVSGTENFESIGNLVGENLRQLGDPQRIADNLIAQLRPIPFIDAPGFSEQNLDKQADNVIAVPIFNQPALQRGRPAVQAEAGTNRSINPYQKITLRQLMQTLVTKVDLPVAATANPQGRFQQWARGPREFLAIQGIVNTPLDPAVISTIAQIISPAVDLSGIVTMNFFGMGNFAFIVSPSTRRINLVDVNTGENMSVSYSQEYGIDIKSQVLIDPSANRGLYQKRNYFILIKKWVITYLLHPLTLFSAGVFFMLWLLWRMRRLDA